MGAIRKAFVSPETDLGFCPVCDRQLFRALARRKFIHIIIEPSRRGKNLLLFYMYLELLESCATVEHDQDVNCGSCNALRIGHG